jgi:AcrR family transcriptional regulator
MMMAKRQNCHLDKRNILKTVFAHFPTREELLNAVVSEIGARVTGRIHELANNGVGIRDVLQAHLKGLAEFELFYTRLVTESQLLPKSARNTLVMIQSAISLHLIQVAESEVVSGKIRPIAMHLLFNTWIGLIHYYLANQEWFAPGESVLPRYGEELLEYFLSFISCSASASK